MNRVLNRPMFRMGGSSGTGITSGLDQQPRKPLQQGSMPNFQFGGVPGFLTSFGLNLLGTPPRGNIFQTAAVAARDPFNRLQEFQTRRALTQAERDFEAKKALEDREFQEKKQKDLIAAQQKMSEREIEAKAAETDKLIASRENIAQMKLNEEKGITVDELAATYLADFDGDLNKATNKARFFLEVRPQLVAQVGGTQIGGIIEADLSNVKSAKRFINQNKDKVGKVFYNINTGQSLLLTKDANNNLGFIPFEPGTTKPGQKIDTQIETDANKILDAEGETEKRKRLEKSYGFYLPDVVDKIREKSKDQGLDIMSQSDFDAQFYNQ
jgi:vacuolar-type H+-ATPase subunit I/STV1